MLPQNDPHESANGSGNGYRAPNLDLRHFQVFKYAYFSWPRMGSTLRMVYMAIAAYADANGYAEPSLAEICDLAEVNSHNTAVAAARELEELGRLTIVRRHASDGAKLSNGYQLTGLEEEWLPRPKNAPNPHPSRSPTCSSPANANRTPPESARKTCIVGSPSLRRGTHGWKRRTLSSGVAIPPYVTQ